MPSLSPDSQKRDPQDRDPQPRGPLSSGQALSSSQTLSSSKPRYWRSMNDLEETPEFQELMAREFPDLDPQAVPELKRRQFLQLMGASAALASLSSCRWEAEQIVPFVRRPEGWTPGVPREFATSIEFGGVAQALLVKNYDGRPIKIEGNPEHPAALGSSSVFAQATTLEWADPDRSRNVYKRDGATQSESSWEAFDDFLEEHFAELRDGGKGLAVLAAPTSSPSTAGMRAKFAKVFPDNAGWFSYEPLNRDEEIGGAAIAFGKPLRTHWKLDEADVQLWLDCDPLGTHPNALRYARDWSKRRVPEDAAKPGARPMSRVYAAESTPSVSGSVADHRLPLRGDRIHALLLEIERQVTGGVSTAVPAWLKEGHVAKFLKALVEDLRAAHGKSLIAVGPRQPAVVHAIAQRVNHALGNLGKTVFLSEEPIDAEQTQKLSALVSAMKSGGVSTLIILGGNPVYDAPAELGFSEALAKVPVSIHLGLYRNETGRRCSWHANEAHPLEAWGDARSWDGSLTLCQPQIEPLHDGRSALELLAKVLGDEVTKGFELLQRTWKGLAAGQSFEPWFKRCLHDGFLANSAFKAQTVSLLPFKAPAAPVVEDVFADGHLELVFTSGAFGDGRFANNAWLAELPDAMSKLTWDNAAYVSPETAEKLGLQDNSFVELSVAGKQLELPTFVLPGQAPGSVAVALGWGRKHAGRVGGSVSDDPAEHVEPIGRDLYPLRTSTSMGSVSALSVKPTGKPYKLASTQDHFPIDRIGMEEREARIDTLIREASFDEWKAEHDFPKHAVHHPPLESLWTERSYDGHQWGMSVDLARCTGCNACIVGCTSENNVPVVGKEQVLVGREMHWMRIDRYFGGDPANPDLAHQPLACAHCELAPCEQVCPVAATVHDSEGLNDMVYNRCVGTRYCGNNCPYKVRRFNYFDNTGHFEEEGGELYKLVVNPEVTVRSRGVMEKCSYCTQRISEERKAAKREHRPLAPDSIKTACQQACPTEAIVFGDLANGEAEVAKRAQLGRSYALLAELNIKPRTTYLAKVGNPHPSLHVPSAAHGKHAAAGHGPEGAGSGAKDGEHGAGGNGKKAH